MSNRHPKPPPKPHTASDILRAVARMLTAPRPGGIGLAVPEEIRNLHRANPAEPARLILPARNGVNHLRRWADALDHIESITATPDAVGGGDMNLVVVGVMTRGPLVRVEAWVLDFPLGLIHPTERVLTLDELHALDGGL